jgi:Tfp pilus assembly protein PilV
MTGLRGKLASEAGLTIVEVTVAAVVMVIGAIGVLGVTDAATRNTYRAEQSQVVVNRLQEELEHVRQLPFDDVATTAAPVHSTDTLNPGYRVNGTSFGLNRDGTNPQPLVYNGRTLPGATSAISGGVMNGGPITWSSGDVHGQIYRYVIAPPVPSSCPNCKLGDLRRVIIAITLDKTGSGGERLYQELQSDVINPDADSGGALPPSGGGGDKTLTTLWLTDTTCNNTDHVAVPGTHLTHNTRGACSDGLRTGTTKGAPDLLNDDPALGSDAALAGTDTGASTLFDYANDVNPSTAPTADIGLSLRRTESADGCTLAQQAGTTLDFPSGEANLAARPWHQKEHLWVSNQLSATFRTLNSFDATLQLSTKTVHNASYAGRLCIYIFKRITVSGGQTVDVLATNSQASPATSFTFTRNPWPTQWTEIAIPLKPLWSSSALTPYNIVGQPRLGIAVQVERDATDAAGLEFMYDHPNFASRIEVQTPLGTTILP